MCSKLSVIIAYLKGVELKAVHIASDFINAADEGTYGPLLGDKSNNLVFDVSKLQNLVPGWAPRMRIDQGLVKTVKYVLEHEELHITDDAYDRWYDSLIEYYEKMTANAPKLETFCK